MAKGSLYPRLAWTNLKKNRQFYLPYLLTVIGSSAAFYIVGALAGATDLPNTTRYFYLSAFMTLGTLVIGLFSVIFLSYTNSFLMKRRKKELGLYNVLGLGKRHLALMLFFETLYTALIALPGGIAMGLLLQKLATLLLLRIAHASGYYGFYISWKSMGLTAALFGAILLLNLLRNILRIRLQNPIELLRDSQAGEQEPKSRWALTVAGCVCLAAGYGIALSTKSAMTALALYFVAVILVIIGTYCLFTSVSIVVLKALRRNKSFYYKINRFIGVSGMLYRMKRNALGLANICILSTMVLVMLSGTLALYLGSEDVLSRQFPGNLELRVRYDPAAERPFSGSGTAASVDKALRELDLPADQVCGYSVMNVYALPAEDGGFTLNPDYTNGSVGLYFISACEYAALSGGGATAESAPLTLGLPGGESITVEAARIEGEAPSLGSSFMSAVDPLWFVLPRTDVMLELHSAILDSYGSGADSFDWHGFWNVSGDTQALLDMPMEVESVLGGMDMDVSGEWQRLEVEGLERFSIEYYSLNGGFFFLGLFLGALFIMAAVLIIYYKQISEGYEDRERYHIMQKVGMERAVVRRSVKRQLLVVFFAPLLVAAVHVAFDYGLMLRLLSLFSLSNAWLSLGCTLGVFAAFCVVYLLVYAATARAYCRIVEA